MSHDLTVLLDRKFEKQLHRCTGEVVTAKHEDDSLLTVLKKVTSHLLPETVSEWIASHS